MGSLTKFLALSAIFALGHAATAATQQVTYGVSAISQISVSGNPNPLIISTATPGSGLTSVIDTSTTYAVTTNQANQKITAALNTNMPTGVTLTLAADAPSGATPAGAVTLTTTAANLVTGITRQDASGKTLTYTLSATTAAGPIANDTRTVTLTILNGP